MILPILFLYGMGSTDKLLNLRTVMLFVPLSCMNCEAKYLIDLKSPGILSLTLVGLVTLLLVLEALAPLDLSGWIASVGEFSFCYLRIM